MTARPSAAWSRIVSATMVGRALELERLARPAAVARQVDRDRPELATEPVELRRPRGSGQPRAVQEHDRRCARGRRQ